MSKKPTSKGITGGGYKTPPTHSQWKKGQSGNPSGKPKKQASLGDKLKKLAEKEIVVIENGNKVTMSQDEAMLVAVFMKAMKGDMAAVKFVTEQLGSEVTASQSPPPLRLGPEDLAVLNNRLTWLEILEEVRADLEGYAPAIEQTPEDPDSDPNDNF